MFTITGINASLNADCYVLDLSVIVVLDGTNSDDGVQEVWSDHRLFL